MKISVNIIAKLNVNQESLTRISMLFLNQEILEILANKFSLECLVYTTKESSRVLYIMYHSEYFLLEMDSITF